MFFCMCAGRTATVSRVVAAQQIFVILFSVISLPVFVRHLCIFLNNLSQFIFEKILFNTSSLYTFRAVTNNLFHCWLICWLFSWLLDELFGCKKVTKVKKPKVPSSKTVQTVQNPDPRYSVSIRQRKAINPHKLMFWIFPEKNDLKVIISKILILLSFVASVVW